MYLMDFLAGKILVRLFLVSIRNRGNYAHVVSWSRWRIAAALSLSLYAAALTSSSSPRRKFVHDSLSRLL